MPDIIVAFNKTENSAYVNYAKLSYDVSYADNPETLRTTATVNLRFYIKPDSYTYTYGTRDRLYLGLRRGSTDAVLERWSVESLTNYGNVYSAVYNHVGSTSVTVEYDGTAEYPIFLAAVYENDHTWRFATFHMPQSDGNRYYQYSYLSGGSNRVMLERRFSYTACGAPAVNLGPTPFENELTLSWVGAAGGVSNPIAGFELQLSESADGSAWGGWTALGTVDSGAGGGNYPAPVGVGRGQYVKCRVRAKGAAGEAWASSWAETSPVRKNAAPSAPPALTVSRAVYGEGDSLSLAWPGAADPDGNLMEYRLEYSVNEGLWTALGTYSGTAATLTPTQAEDGGSIRYRVQAVDSYGVPGPWREGPAVLRDDPTGIGVCKNGQYKKAYMFVCRDGVWQKARALTCKDGVFYEPK